MINLHNKSHGNASLERKKKPFNVKSESYLLIIVSFDIIIIPNNSEAFCSLLSLHWTLQMPLGRQAGWAFSGLGFLSDSWGCDIVGLDARLIINREDASEWSVVIRHKTMWFRTKLSLFLFAKLKIWHFIYIYINFYSSININGFVINGQNKCIPNSKTNVTLGNDRQINLGPMCRRFW